MAAGRPQDAELERCLGPAEPAPWAVRRAVQGARGPVPALTQGAFTTLQEGGSPAAVRGTHRVLRL